MRALRLQKQLPFRCLLIPNRYHLHPLGENHPSEQRQPECLPFQLQVILRRETPADFLPRCKIPVNWFSIRELSGEDEVATTTSQQCDSRRLIGFIIIRSALTNSRAEFEVFSFARLVGLGLEQKGWKKKTRVFRQRDGGLNLLPQLIH